MELPETSTDAALAFSLPHALAVLPGPRAALAGAEAQEVSVGAARRAFEGGPVLVAHAALTARRLGLSPPARARDLLDVLELWAFVRPARFCAPSPAGLARALGRPEPKTPAEQARALGEAATELLAELAEAPTPSREEALAVASTLERAGWAWGPAVVEALRAHPVRDRAFRGSGLDAWARRPEWRDEAPAGEPGSTPVTPEAAEARLAELLVRSGLDEARPSQARFAAETAFAFSPREREDEPRMMLAEAGTGVGKTLGYLAPASLWAEANGAAVWVSTYTRALQRQIERESHSLYPDPEVRARKAVVRKGRENYACLLNYEDLVRSAMMGAGDLIGVGLASRWMGATRDGDMSGGDWPAWLPTLFAVGALNQAGPANLVDRRGECMHAGCSHYRACFVEHSIRASRRADIVIANHALVLHHAAIEGGRSRKDGESAALKRLVFDEGHHLFAAADSTFSACLSGQEAAELRRWVRGPEGRKRGRGLELRLAGVLGLSEDAARAMGEAIRACSQLPGEGWSGRIAPPVDPDGERPEPTPFGPVEAFLAALLEQVRARAEPARRGGDVATECAALPPVDAVRLAAPAAAAALAAVEAPLVALARALEDLLDDEADELETADRARIEGVLRGLDRRARMQLPAWRRMLSRLADDAGEPEFVDAFEAVWSGGRVADAAFRRNYVDPTEPLTAAVLKPAHGVLVTSATLSDPRPRQPLRSGRDAHGGRAAGGESAAAEGGEPVRLRRPEPLPGGHRRGEGRSPAGGGGHARAVPGGGGRRGRPVHRHPPPARGARPHCRPAGRGRDRAARPARRSHGGGRAGGRVPGGGGQLPARHRRGARRDRRAGSLAPPAGVRPHPLAAPRPPAQGASRAVREGGLRRRHRPRARRPGVRPPDSPRGRPGGVRGARRRQPHPPLQRPAAGRRAAPRGPGGGHRGGGRLRGAASGLGASGDLAGGRRGAKEKAPALAAPGLCSGR